VTGKSIWRKYLAGVSSTRWLGQLLDEDVGLLHPFVLGELTLGACRTATMWDVEIASEGVTARRP
jgi:hypothetical protein